MAQTEPTLYTQVGGMEFFHRLANAFYDRIKTDTFLRPMFPGSLHCARKHLALFLAQFFGGPTEYNVLRGHPRLRIRHQPFEIGQEERDRWLAHMLAAMEEVGVPEPAHQVMIDTFTATSTCLINQPAQSSADSVVNPPEERSCGVSSEVADVWNQLTVVDNILDAVRAADLPALLRLLEEPTICQHLAIDRVAYRDILALALHSTDADIRQEAQTRLTREPDLVSVRGCHGFTLLHEAAADWDAPLLELLLHLGADPNVTDNGGHSPLYHAANRTVPRQSESLEGGRRTVDRLLQHGANANTASGVKRVTPLHMAARRGNVPIAEALLAQGIDLEARDSTGETPLRRAVNCGHPHLVALLLAHGADAETRDNRSLTPLDAARNREIRALLLKAMI